MRHDLTMISTPMGIAQVVLSAEARLSRARLQQLYSSSRTPSSSLSSSSAREAERLGVVG